MIICSHIEELSNNIKHLRSSGKTIGFVPTMGALHQGHVSLIAASQKHHSTVCSVFVNPTQFNDEQDYAKYPITIEADIRLLESQGIDILFLPSVQEVYPYGLSINKRYELGDLETTLEGFYRPNHFQGVCQVVDRLLEVVRPDYLFLGQKDYQQCLVLQKLVRDKAMPTVVEICQTYREGDGLAMSSRNARLTRNMRPKASAIYQALSYIKDNIREKSTLEQLKAEAAVILANSGFDNIDYIEICDVDLQVLNRRIRGPMVALIAATLDNVRLIDNLVIE